MNERWVLRLWKSGDFGAYFGWLYDIGRYISSAT